MRQLWDGKGSAEIELMSASTMATYAGLCGWSLARAHARTGDRRAIADYLGKSDKFDRAIAEFSEAYADQNEADYEVVIGAERAGPSRSRAASSQALEPREFVDRSARLLTPTSKTCSSAFGSWLIDNRFDRRIVRARPEASTSASRRSADARSSPARIGPPGAAPPAPPPPCVTSFSRARRPRPRASPDLDAAMRMGVGTSLAPK